MRNAKMIHIHVPAKSLQYSGDVSHVAANIAESTDFLSQEAHK